jgi:hypothetical protein
MKSKKKSDQNPKSSNNSNILSPEEKKNTTRVLESSNSDDFDNQLVDSEIEEKELLDLKKLRLSQNFSELAGVKKALLTVPVRKPNRYEFFRVNPSEDWCFETAVLEFKEERETFLVDRSLWPVLSGELVPKVLFAVINRQGVLSIWPIRLPGEDGRLDPWNKSALEAAKIAKKRWISVRSNMSLAAYEVWEASADIPEPEWPENSFQEILQIAFRDNYVESEDHPAIKRLRGEV